MANSPAISRPPFLRSASSNSSRSTASTKDKPRLYITLYPRGGSWSTSSFRDDFNCDSHHWSVTTGPPQTAARNDPGTRYHVAHLDHGGGQYLYEEQDIAAEPAAQTALIRITIGKVRDDARLASVMRAVAVPQDDSAFNCLTWVRAAFTQMLEDGKAVKSNLRPAEWAAVESCARKYCRRKRNAGRFQEGSEGANINGWNMDTVSTFNYCENRETAA